MRNVVWVMVVAAALGISGCKTKRDAERPGDASNQTTDTSGAGQDGVSQSGLDAGGIGEGETAGPQGELLSKRIVYFEYDRAEVKSEDAPIVAAHARYLASNASARIRLEGHTDERGTREYNIGLGERRAQTVRRAMMLQGVAESQIATVSYGEERPAGAGSDEMGWSQNRRVEIVYLK